MAALSIPRPSDDGVYVEAYHGRRIDGRWRERVRLDDGSAILLRMLRADDRARLAEGFARLSEASRYRRFLLARSTLSEEELRYLTRIDGERHVAIAAGRCIELGDVSGAFPALWLDAPSFGEGDREPSPDSLGFEGEGLGVGRFIALDDAPGLAEVAITVIDDAQGLGIGRLLLDRLAQAARERGLVGFRAVMLANNRPMRALMKSLDPRAKELRDGAELILEARW